MLCVSNEGKGAKARESFSVVGRVRHELSHSKAMAICNREAAYSVNEGVAFGSFSVGDHYVVDITCFPAGTTHFSSRSDLNHSACYIGLTLQAISDPTGSVKSGWRTVTMSLESVDREGSPCLNGTTPKPWGRDIREDVQIEKVLSNVSYLWLGHKNNFAEIFKRNRNFVVVEIKDPHQGQPGRLRQRASALQFNKQQQCLYENSKKYGDISLRVIVSDSAGHCVFEAPRKRRKKMDGGPIRSVGGEEATTMRASSIILRSASAVFEAHLLNEMKEREESTIEIHAQRAQDVDDMMFFIICHDLREDVRPLSLIKLAHFYALEHLVAACATRILIRLSVENFTESVNTYTRYEIASGYSTLVEFGRSHLDEIKKHDSWADLGFAFKFGALLSPPEDD